MIDIVELLGDRKFQAHSSIVLTYAVDLVLYEGFLRRELRGAGAANQILFCDGTCYEGALSGMAASRSLGKAYSVTPVHQEGAFHPKVYLLLGTQRGRMLIGSGNATLGGLTRNGELFGAFEFDAAEDQGPHPAFAEIMGFVRVLAEKAPLPVRTQIKLAIDRTAWLSRPAVGDDRTVLIGGPGRPPLLDQLVAGMGGARIDEVLVCSASFDRQLRAIDALSQVSGGRPVKCLVQPEHVAIDGAAVRRLGNAAEWRSLSLAHLRRNGDARDVFGHAKLLVFGSGKQEWVAYGSANASAPALLNDRANTEIMVLLPPLRRGTAVKHLELAASLESPDIYGSMVSLEWPAPSAEEAESTPLLLCGISFEREGLVVTFNSDPPHSELYLALSDTHDDAAPTTMFRISKRADGHWFCPAPKEASAIRVGWIADTDRKRLSNSVAITWSEVAETRSGSGAGHKYDDAIAAIQDGHLLSTALYELLEKADDLPASYARSAEAPKQTEGQDVVDERSQQSFYTDLVVHGGHALHLSSERLDLDLLASLVRPLPSADVQDDVGPLTAGEEDERRELDASGSADPTDDSDSGGRDEQKPGSLDTSVVKIEQSARRLARRLDRAARAAEDALGVPNYSLSPASFARQMWMTHVAAFLAGREVETNDGKATCLSADAFARYVIRLAHALAGGKRGGLLKQLPAAAWTGYDGEKLKRGLAFVWTCVGWAAAHVRWHWEFVAEPTEHPATLAEAIPDLVAAHFSVVAESYCDGPDETDLSRRLPAFNPETLFKRMSSVKSVDQIKQLLKHCETTPPGEFPPVPPRVDPGTLVFNAGLGLTVAIRSQSDGIYLADLSRPVRGKPSKTKAKSDVDPPWLVKCVALVSGSLGAQSPMNTFCRPTKDLVENWRRRERASI